MLESTTHRTTRRHGRAIPHHTHLSGSKVRRALMHMQLRATATEAGMARDNGRRENPDIPAKEE
jgi:hypothetical protein